MKQTLQYPDKSQAAPAPAIKRVRISNSKNPLYETWIDYLDDELIHSYRMAGYIVAEVSP